MKGTLGVICVFVAVALLIGCYNEKSRENFSGRQELNEEITREYYEVFGAGVWGEVESKYLTDSTTFRAFIGTRDEHQKYLYEVSGDIIKVEKFDRGGLEGNVLDTMYFLSIEELRNNPVNRIK